MWKNEFDTYIMNIFRKDETCYLKISQPTLFFVNPILDLLKPLFLLIPISIYICQSY